MARQRGALRQPVDQLTGELWGERLERHLDRLDALGHPEAAGPVAAFHAQIASPEPAKPSLSGEAVAALMGLGVAEASARRVVEQAAARLGEEAAAPALIKAALQELGR